MTTKSTNNVIIVTGASRGIGAAISHHFAERGWCVIAAARNIANVDASADGDRRVVPVEVEAVAAVGALRAADEGRRVRGAVSARKRRRKLRRRQQRGRRRRRRRGRRARRRR